MFALKKDTHLKKLKKVIASAIAASMLAAVIAVGGLASAKPAQAYSGSYDYYQIAWGCVHYYKWIDYNWWQEYFEGKRDGYKLVAIEC